MSAKNKKTLRVLYAGGLFKGSTGLERLGALRKMGHTVTTFNFDPYNRQGNRIVLSFHNRLAWGPAVPALNRDLVKFANTVDYELVWVSKGVWLYPGTVQELKKGGDACVLHYTPDAQILENRTRHFIKSIPVYDVLITSKPWEVAHYKKYNARNVVNIPQGVNLELLRPYDVSGPEYSHLRSDVCFIGRYEPFYRRCVRSVLDTGVNMAVWGPWQRYFFFHPWLRKVVRGSGVWHKDYAKAICCAKIGLGLLSKSKPETATTRTFEIPACGTFMLAERTDEHVEYFEEGKEAEFFDSTEEMQNKIRYYLAHDAERERIAKAGRERCIKSSYGNDNRMRQCLTAVFPNLSCDE